MLESGPQLAALETIVAIHRRNAAVLDIEINGVSENNQLDYGRSEQNHTHAWIPQHLDELLPNDSSDSSPHARQSLDSASESRQ